MKVLKIYILLVIGIAFAGESLLAQRRQIDSLCALIKTGKEDTVQVKHYLKLYFQYFPMNKYDTCLIYLNKGLFLAKKITVGKEHGWKKGIAHCYNNIGVINWRKGNYQLALTNYLAAKKEYAYIHYNPGLVLTNNNIGLICDEQGKYADALIYYFLALKVAEQINNKYNMTMCNNNLGNAYHWLKNDSLALIHLNTSLKLAKELDSKVDISLAYNNIGLVYDGQLNFTKALKNYFAALKINTEESNESGMAMNYNNIGIVYYRQHNNKEALKMYLMSLNIEEKLNDKKGLVGSYRNLGDLYREAINLKQADFYVNKSIFSAKEIGRKYDIVKGYESLIKIDSTKGDYKAAYRHHLLFDAYNDSIFNEEAQKKGIQATMQYAFDKKETALKFEADKSLLEFEIQNKLNTQKQFFLIIGFIGFALLTGVLLFFGKRAYHANKKYSEVLAKENETKELLMQEVHHRINNSLQMISSLLSIQADTAINRETQSYLIKTETRIHTMSAMHQLLQEANTGLEVDINLYLHKVINFYKQVLENYPDITLDVQIPSNILNSKTALPLALIVNELLTNAIKYAFPNKVGVIKILLTKTERTLYQWQLSISDNGTGLPTDKTPLNESSLGLELVTIMTKQLGGKLNTFNNNGANFVITFNGLTL